METKARTGNAHGKSKSVPTFWVQLRSLSSFKNCHLRLCHNTQAENTGSPTPNEGYYMLFDFLVPISFFRVALSLNKESALMLKSINACAQDECKGVTNQHILHDIALSQVSALAHFSGTRKHLHSAQNNFHYSNFIVEEKIINGQHFKTKSWEPHTCENMWPNMLLICCKWITTMQKRSACMKRIFSVPWVFLFNQILQTQIKPMKWQRLMLKM